MGRGPAGTQAAEACPCPESSTAPLSRPPVAPGPAGRPVTEQSGKSPIHTRFLLGGLLAPPDSFLKLIY